MSESVEKQVARFLEEQAKEGPADRWRKPVRPVVVEPTNEEIRIDGDVVRGGFNATFDDETIERFRTGQACLKCWEPQRSAFPVVCSLPGCGYRIRERQTIDFQEQYEGKKWVGPSTSLSDEYERMKDDGARRRHKPGSSIIVPRGVKS